MRKRNKDQLAYSAAVGCFVTCLTTLGCATTSSQLGVAPVALSGPVEIQLKGAVGEEEITRYYSHSQVRSFEDVQIVREKDEIVDFQVSEKVKSVDSQKGEINVTVTTLQKDGTVDLHDLAFPEKGQEIEYVFQKNGKVLKADPFPRDSVFFVPPLPLPDKPVEVGDTWTLDHSWVGLKNGIPLTVRMVGILKNLYPCGSDKGLCADLDISGHVQVMARAETTVQFESSIWGRVLFALDRGVVLWSEMRSQEKMILPDSRVEVLSCMTSALQKPEGWVWPAARQVNCKPSEQTLVGIPGTRPAR